MKPGTLLRTYLPSVEGIKSTLSLTCSPGVWFGDGIRHFRLYGLFVQTCLLREMMFRANFLVRSVTHLIWLGVMLVFLRVIYLHTQRIGDWDQFGLLFFMGTYLTLNATANCLFINGCSRFSELIRTGNLDFELLRPVDELFLLTCQRIDWSLIPQVVFGFILSWYAVLPLSLHIFSSLWAVNFSPPRHFVPNSKPSLLFQLPPT